MFLPPFPLLWIRRKQTKLQSFCSTYKKFNHKKAKKILSSWGCEKTGGRERNLTQSNCYESFKDLNLKNEADTFVSKTLTNVMLI